MSAADADVKTGATLDDDRSPARDAKGRPLDPARIADAAELPPRLHRLVTDLARATRLRRAERADVAAETATHLRDLLDAGVDEATAAGAFGESRDVARLIRRAKKRGRHPVEKALKLGALGVVGLLALYLALGAYLTLSVPVPTVDYVARVNERARQAVESGEAGWPALRAAFVDLDFGAASDSPAGEAVMRVRWAGAAPWRPESTREDHADWPEARAWLEAHAEPLEAVRRAAEAPALGFLARRQLDPADASLFGPEAIAASAAGAASPAPDPAERLMRESVVAIQLPHLTQVRRAGMLLALDLLAAAEDRDGDRVLANLRATNRLAVHLTEVRTLIGDLVGTAIRARALEALGRVLLHDPAALTDDDLRRLAHELAGWEDLLDASVIAAEQRFFEDMVQRTYSRGGPGGGQLTTTGMRMLSMSLSSAGTEEIGPFGLPRDGLAAMLLEGAIIPARALRVAPRDEMLAEGRRLYGMLERGFDRPLHEHPLDEFTGEISVSAEDGRWHRYLLVHLLVPAVQKAHEHGQQHRMQRDAMLLVLAAEAARRENGGAWPQDPGVLVPDLLPQVPTDLADGAPLRYRLPDAGDGPPTVYSVGTDGDDDGGARREDPADWRRGSRPAPSFDWVFWPPADDA